MIQARGELAADMAEEGWSTVRVNFTVAQARQLAAQLIAAADSHDGINHDVAVMRRLEKIALHVGADISGP